MTSELILGPLYYSHVVQKISVNEQKATEVIQATRSNKNFIIDSGESIQRAQIHFLFSGAKAINEGIIPLIVLFKVSPFTSVRNELLSNSWRKIDKNYDDENIKKVDNFVQEKIKSFEAINKATETNLQYLGVPANASRASMLDNNLSYYNRIISNLGQEAIQSAQNEKFTLTPTALSLSLKKNVTYSDYIPITLDSLTISSVDDMPDSFMVVLTVTRIDTEPVTGAELLYQGEKKHEFSPDPRKAYWLKKWIKQVIDSSSSSPYYIGADTSKELRISWYGTTLAGYDVTEETRSTAKFRNRDIVYSSSSSTKVLAESATINNYFGYQKLIGKGTPTAQHVGSSAVSYSLDLSFNGQVSDIEFQNFCNFKETSDDIIRSVDKQSRLNGWKISSPLLQLLRPLHPNGGGLDWTLSIDATPTRLYVPLSVAINTTEQPYIKHVHIDLSENNINVLKEKNGQIVSGGTSILDLRHYFDLVVKGEEEFRTSVKNNPSEVAKAISGQANLEDIAGYDMYKVFWPIKNNSVQFSNVDAIGILNVDTLRASLLTDEIKAILTDDPLSAGKVIIGNTKPNILQRLELNRQTLEQLFDGPNNSRLLTAVRSIVNSSFTGLTDDEAKDLALYISVSYLGDLQSAISLTRASAKAINVLAKSSVKFTPDYLTRLFNTIVDRKSLPEMISNAYDIEGVLTAFYKLSSSFFFYADSHPSAISPTVAAASEPHVYQDLLLPTYRQLYGDDWMSFAPTYDDLGSINWDKDKNSIDQNGGDTNIATLANISALQNTPAVNDYDIVEPHCFFYSKRYKPELRSALESGTKLTAAKIHTLTLSVPFNTDEIKELESVLSDKPKDPNTSNLTLSKVIKSAVSRIKSEDRDKFEQIRNDIRAANIEPFVELQNNGLKVYVNYNNNIVVPHKMTTAGKGGELYRAIDEALYLNSTGPRLENALNSPTPSIGTDVSMRSAGELAATEFIRHEAQSIDATVQSSVSQIPDDYRSAAKLFPAAKVYLIERRGNDIIVDDLISNINNIISIDITQDKDDPDLAVIKIADPLLTLQQSLFPKGNRERTGAKTDKVYANSRAGDESLERRLKIVQGRPIQIRLGYSSLPKNLPIVFTGRITEVVPGEVLTIVAQSWKAELLGRQVTFVNKDPKNWGAKDLAVQAIQYAEPQGMGEWFSQNSADYLLQNMSTLDAADMVNHILTDVGSDVEQVPGSRGLVSDKVNAVQTLFGFRSNGQKDVGIDTRLKNIWYPDTIKYNNVLGVRSTFGFQPAFINDGWIVPMQPAWDVLKEASRHAWNCIVQVVPYDTESTIFFGHPDQPYYWTRGESIGKSRYKKYTERIKSKNLKLMTEAYTEFKVSTQYSNIDEDRKTFALTGSALLTNMSSFLGITSLFWSDTQRNTLVRLVSGNDYLRDQSPQAFIDESTLPLEAYYNLKRSFKDFTGAILLDLAFNVRQSKIQLSWPSIDQDLTILLGNNKAEIDLAKDRVISSIGGIKSYRSYKATAKSIFEEYLKKTSIVLPTYEIPKYIKQEGLAPLLDLLYEIGTIETNAAALNVKQYINATTLQSNEGLKEYSALYNRVLASLDETKVYNSGLISNKDSTLVETLLDNLAAFKAFVYYFDKFCKENSAGANIANTFQEQYVSVLPPTMRTFRVHHWIDSNTDIIQNGIIATTNEMWNTVVIEHPGQGESDNAIPSAGDLARENRYSSAVKWSYYPKQDVVGVIGLQFNPALTLANKKINVVTELNCQSEELAAKLACTHLADGIRRMYRGTLVIRGRNIKPHDRIILDDQINEMAGPLEVESLIHHWNPSQGWITNIVPQAVCDANPGAAILATGLMEAQFRKIFNTIDFINDVVTVALIIGTLGGASVARGATGIAGSGIKRLFTQTLNAASVGEPAAVAKIMAARLKNLGGKALSSLSLNPLTTLNRLVKNFGGLGLAYGKATLFTSIADQAAYQAFRMNIITAFVNTSNKAKQLPVILSPLLHHGLPFTAGLETDDALFSIFANDIFYGYRSMQIAAGKLLNEFLGTDQVNITK